MPRLPKLTKEMVDMYMGNKASHDMWLTADEVRTLGVWFNLTKSTRRLTPFLPGKKNPKYLYTITRRRDARFL